MPCCTATGTLSPSSRTSDCAPYSECGRSAALGANRPEGGPPTKIAPEGAPTALTEKRLELLRFVAGYDGLNVRRPASELGRDYKNVHTDVAELIELGLLERDADGRLSAPFDEIVIHANIRNAA